MVAALIMSAVIKPHPPFVKIAEVDWPQIAVIPGCADQTRVYPSLADLRSKSATADLVGAGPE
jgi:hypothetical protein